MTYMAAVVSMISNGSTARATLMISSHARRCNRLTGLPAMILPQIGLTPPHGVAARSSQGSATPSNQGSSVSAAARYRDTGAGRRIECRLEAGLRGDGLELE